MEENTEKAIQYLFGELADTERDTLEDRLFSDEEFAFFLSAVEKDLIDDYTGGEMNSALRRRFEEKYLISERRREKVRLAGILQKEVFAEKETVIPIAAETKPAFWQTLAEFFRVPNFALAGGLAAILLLILFSWIIFRKSSDVPEIVKDDNKEIQIPTPRISPEISPLPESNIKSDENSNIENNADNSGNKEIKKPEKKPTPANSATEKREVVQPQPRIFITTFLPMTRTEEKRVLTIPKNTQTIQLRVVHDNLKPFAKYRTEIRNQNGELILSRVFAVNEKNPSRPVILNLKGAALGAGSYELTLRGITDENQAEEIKFYNFVIIKK